MNGNDERDYYSANEDRRELARAKKSRFRKKRPAPREMKGGEKVLHFFSFNKYIIAVGSVFLLAGGIILYSYMTKTEPDLSAVMFTDGDITREDVNEWAGAMEIFLETYVEDINGDGEVTVQIVAYDLGNGSESGNADRSQFRTMLAESDLVFASRGGFERVFSDDGADTESDTAAITETVEVSVTLPDSTDTSDVSESGSKKLETFAVQGIPWSLGADWEDCFVNLSQVYPQSDKIIDSYFLQTDENGQFLFSYLKNAPHKESADKIFQLMTEK